MSKNDDSPFDQPLTKSDLRRPQTDERGPVVPPPAPARLRFPPARPAAACSTADEDRLKDRVVRFGAGEALAVEVAVLAARDGGRDERDQRLVEERVGRVQPEPRKSPRVRQ